MLPRYSTHRVIYVAYFNLQSHNSVLPVANVLTTRMCVLNWKVRNKPLEAGDSYLFYDVQAIASNEQTYFFSVHIIISISKSAITE